MSGGLRSQMDPRETEIEPQLKSTLVDQQITLHRPLFLVKDEKTRPERRINLHKRDMSAFWPMPDLKIE